LPEETHTEVESTDTSWRVVSNQDERHEKGGREGDAGDTPGWGSGVG